MALPSAATVIRGLAAIGGAIVLVACAGDPSLVVELRSDLVPGVEVVRAVTYVRVETTVVAMAERELAGADLLEGARVAEIGSLPRGSYVVALDLVGPTGAVVFSDRVLLDLMEDRAVTIVAARRCRGASPADGCEPGPCTSAAGCTPPIAACAEALCIEGDCLEGGRAGGCGAAEVCVPDMGCVVTDGSDAGGTDAGGTDAGGTDAGGTDAGGTDAGGTDAGGTDAGGTDAGTDAGVSPCPGECSPGDGDTDREGCGDCGTRTRNRSCGDDCRWQSWGSWSGCSGEGRCTPGARATFGCGTCGLGSWTCTCQSDCNRWAGCGSCTGDVSCTDFVGASVCPGSTGSRTCPTMPMGVQRCTCSSSGNWVSCSPGCIL